jgi:hypothetical protein
MVLNSHEQYLIYVSFFSSSFSLLIVTKIAIQLDKFVPKLLVVDKSLMMVGEVRIGICKIGML